MKSINYIIWREGEYFVSQCIENNITSFGENPDEAKKNLFEALELFFEDNDQH